MPRYGLDGLEVKFNVGDIFSARPDRPRGTFNLLCNRCLILPGGKAVGGRGGGGVDHPAPSNANVAIPPPSVCDCTGMSRGNLSLLCCLHLQDRSLYKKFPYRTFGFVTAISHACHLKANEVCDRCGSGVRSTNDQLYYSDYVKRITNEADP